MDEEIVCGIDEAGRGPILGPLVLACVLLDSRAKKTLAKMGVRDSKKLSPERREQLEPEIKKHALEWSITKISPPEIDRLRNTMSLNDIEALKISELIMGLDNMPHKIIVDAADTVQESFGMRIVSHTSRLNPEFMLPQIVSEHKADDRYVEVGAASIIAKVERDREIRTLSLKHGEIGSGYPSDTVTQEYLRRTLRGGVLPDFVRRSWNTLEKSKQMTLTEF